MSREADLKLHSVDELKQIIEDLSIELGEDLPISGNKAELIDRIIAAEKRLTEEATEQLNDAATVKETKDDAGRVTVRALKTFETLDDQQKVLVLAGETAMLSARAAQDAIAENLATPA